jgi:hypothetical protein
MKNKNYFFLFIIISILLIIYLIYNDNIQENFVISRNIMVSYLTGGLGNRIYMIMAGLSFAEKWNMDYYFLESEIIPDGHSNNNTIINELKLLFPDIKFLNKSTDTKLWKGINEKDVVDKIDNSNNIILSGFFQNEDKYFNNYKINFPEPSNNIFKNIDTSRLFFIHFRFGDYIGTNFELNLVDYYKYCINKIKNIIKDTLFFVITNDTEMTKKYIKTNNLLNQNEYFIDESNNRLHTLYYISKCKGGICSNSTFSRIGAYFIKNRDKRLIFYPIKKEENINISWLTTHIIN